MPEPQILIDQAGLPPGTPKQSRRDVVVGVLVQLSDPANAGIGTHVWTMIPPPLSSATLTNPTTPTPTFVPDVTGPYLIFLTVNGNEFSFTLDADLNPISSQGGVGVELPNGTLAHGAGESFQFDALIGYARRFDELFPFFDQLRGGVGGGWIRITGVTVPGGSTSNEVYQDAPANTILQSITTSSGTFDVAVEASYPLVDVAGFAATLPRVVDIYAGTVSVTVTESGDVVAQVVDPDNTNGASDTVAVTLDAPPTLLTLSFLGGYPGAQTELKAGDTYQLTGTTDVPADAIEVQDFGASVGTQLLLFASGLTFTVTMVIGDRGTTLQALAASVRARSSNTGALGTARATNELGGVVDGTDLVNLNNLFPSVAIGAIAYPGGQGALKGAEVATVVNTASDFDSIAYDSPGAELTITNPATQEDPKTVTRLAGAYNISVDNFRITANRAANDATTVQAEVVSIANVAATLTVTEPEARLRSGGSNGTAPQDHSITITANQDLLAAPTLAPDAGARGLFQGAFTGGPTVWSALLRVDDADDKGVFNWGAILGTNLAGIATAAITGDAQYELGGFVLRSLTYAAFATQTALGTEVVDFAKLNGNNLAGFTSTANPALKQPIGTTPSVQDGFTIDALATSPTQVIWLDSAAASSNSSGTAQITNVEEVV